MRQSHFIPFFFGLLLILFLHVTVSAQNTTTQPTTNIQPNIIQTPQVSQQATTTKSTVDLNFYDSVSAINTPFPTNCIANEFPEEKDRYIGLFLDRNACKTRKPKKHIFYISSGLIRYYADQLPKADSFHMYEPDINKMFFIKPPLSISYTNNSGRVSDLLTYVGFGCTGLNGEIISKDYSSTDGIDCYTLYALNNTKFSFKSKVNTKLYKLFGVETNDDANIILYISLGLSDRMRSEVVPAIPEPLQEPANYLMSKLSYFYLAKYKINTALTYETNILENKFDYLYKAPIPLSEIIPILQPSNSSVDKEIVRSNNLYLRQYISKQILKGVESLASIDAPKILSDLFKFWPSGSGTIYPERFFCWNGTLGSSLIANKTITNVKIIHTQGPGPYSGLSKCNLAKQIKETDKNGNILWRHTFEKDYCFYIEVETYLRDEILNSMQDALSNGQYNKTASAADIASREIFKNDLIDSRDPAMIKYRIWLFNQHKDLFKELVNTEDFFSYTCKPQEFDDIKSRALKSWDYITDEQLNITKDKILDQIKDFIIQEGGVLGPQRDFKNILKIYNDFNSMDTLINSNQSDINLIQNNLKQINSNLDMESQKYNGGSHGK